MLQGCNIKKSSVLVLIMSFSTSMLPTYSMESAALNPKYQPNLTPIKPDYAGQNPAVLRALKGLFGQIEGVKLTNGGNLVMIATSNLDRKIILNLLGDTYGFKVIQENRNPNTLGDIEGMWGQKDGEIFIRRGGVPKLLIKVLGFDEPFVRKYYTSYIPSLDLPHSSVFVGLAFQPPAQPDKADQAAQVAQPKVDMVADWKQWNYKLANLVNKYFEKPYEHQSDYKKSKIINGVYYSVPRPNHALAHGMRSGFTAVDIAEAFAVADPKSFKSSNTRNLSLIIKKYLANDPDFLKKLEMAAVFQRTGRQSEITGKESPEMGARYDSYMEADARIFSEEAQKLMNQGQLFNNKDEILAYTRAVYNDPKVSKSEPLSGEYDQLREIVHTLIWAGHMLDLKRLANERADSPDKSYPANGIKASAAINMGFPELIDTQKSKDWKNYKFRDDYPFEKDFVDKIWNREEKYLEATGDRPLRGKTFANPHYEDKFFTQAKNPRDMVDALIAAKLEMDAAGETQ